MTVRSVVFAVSLLLLPTLAPAQTLEDYDYENLEFRGVGVEVNAVWPADVERTVAFGLRGDLGFVGPRVRIVPSVRYWTARMQQEEVDRLAAQIVEVCERQVVASCPSSLDLGEVHLSDVDLSADAHFLVETGFNVEPYVGGGVSLNLLNGRGEFIDDTFVEDLLDSVAPGLTGLGGVNVELGALQLMAEGRYTLSSDVRFAAVLLGATVTLPSLQGGEGAAFRPRGR